MFEWPTKAKIESTDYVAICDAEGNEKKIAVDELKNIQKEETTGETVEEWIKAKLKSYADFSDGFYPDLRVDPAELCYFYFSSPFSVEIEFSCHILLAARHQTGKIPSLFDLLTCN